jgi:spermidine synthase
MGVRFKKKNLPKAKIKIIDTIETLRNSVDLPKFDLIVIDNPMNLWAFSKQHASIL